MIESGSMVNEKGMLKLPAEIQSNSEYVIVLSAKVSSFKNNTSANKNGIATQAVANNPIVFFDKPFPKNARIVKPSNGKSGMNDMSLIIIYLLQ